MFLSDPQLQAFWQSGLEEVKDVCGEVLPQDIGVMVIITEEFEYQGNCGIFLHSSVAMCWMMVGSGL